MSDRPKKQQKRADEKADIDGIAWPRAAATPDQAFNMAHKAMRTLIEAGCLARLAGGCVRDRILGLRPKDYDIATDAHPDLVSRIFIQKGIKVVPTGIDHGTVTVVLAGQGIEVTSLRRDVSTDGRRAQVEFGSSYREDAARRDFTMNALYEDLEGRVFDYYDGLSDLQQGILRFVGDPVQRIREDYLRILRLFRFWARFEFMPAPGTLEAIASEVAGLEQISQERITSELLATLSEDEIEAPLLAMQSSGTLARVLKTTENLGDLKRLSAYKSIRKAERSLCRLAALLRGKANSPQESTFIESLRLSSRQKQQVFCLLEPPPLTRKSRAESMETLDQLEKIWGTEGILAAALPAWALLYPEQAGDVDALRVIEEQSGPRRRAPLPLTGQDLIEAHGLKPGPALGLLLHALKVSFREEQWSSAAEGLTWAEAWLKKLPET